MSTETTTDHAILDNAVLQALINDCNRSANTTTLSAAMDLPIRTVQKALKRLERSGHVTSEYADKRWVYSA